MKIQLLLLAMMASVIAYAQTNDPRIASTKTSLSAIEQITLPTIDNKTLREQELERRAQHPDVAPQFATAIDVGINPNNHGNWEQLPNGNALWRLRLLSKGAYSLNLGFSQYKMPKGGTLILYTPDQKKIIGPFTVSDNEAHEQLWTPILVADEMVIEVQLPPGKRSELHLELSKVNHDFMNFFEPEAGACHLDVVCDAANGWGILDHYRDAIQSVAVYGFNGTTICTGFLLNNTQGDCTPYFATANHCGVTADNAPSMVVYWNYENSTCRDPNAGGGGILGGDGLLDNFNTGATFKANYALTDFTLVELDDPIADSTNAYFAGWNLSPEQPMDTVVLIHHPGGEEKRATLSYGGTIIGAWGNGATPVFDGNYLIVPHWDVGSSEGGSSGAPLFDKNQRVVGQLRGGTADCKEDGFDAFGWIRYSWQGGGTQTSSLQPWLDPANSGIISMDGKQQATCNVRLTASTPFEQVCTPTSAIYAISVSDGFSDPVQLTLTGVPDGGSVLFSQNPVMPGEQDTIIISTTNLPSGEYTLHLIGTDGTQAQEIILGLLVSSSETSAIATINPANAAGNVSIYPNFMWASAGSVATYELQVASDSLFNNIIINTQQLNDTLFNDTTRLEPLTTYFWRVRSSNPCGTSDWSSTQRFTTAEILCSTIQSTDVPKEISDLLPGVVTSNIDMTLPGVVVDVKVHDLDITHSWIGDIQVSLSSPEGKSVRLFDRPGVPNDLFGCGGQNAKVSFSTNAPKTAANLEMTCNADPAIAGEYQPLDPFSFLAGEMATGIWKLSVEDFVEGDGGSLNSWTLEVCAAVPKNVNITVEADSLATCLNGDVSFPIFVGKDFDKSGVTLSASGNPQGSTVNFSTNPAQPGDTVLVSVQNLSVGGIFGLVLSATDGKDTTNTELQINVLEVPKNYALLTPTNNAENIPLSTSLRWEAPPNAIAYIVTVSEDSGAILVTDTLNTNSYLLNNLKLGTKYNWHVQAINPCGMGDSELFSFTTIPDLSFSVTPININACPTDKPSFNVNIGSGYQQPTMVNYTVSPDVPLPLTFSADTSNVPVGTTIKANFGNLSDVPPDEYTITFRVSDGVHTNEDQVTLHLRDVPAVPALLQPMDGSLTTEQAPMFVWRKITDATKYRIEIANNDGFGTILRSAEVADTMYTVDPPLGGGSFFWRVTSLNDCGFSTSGIFDFFIQGAGVQEWQGQRVTFQPNPTNGILNVLFTQPLSGNLIAEVYAANGQLLRRQSFEQMGTELSFNLAAYPTGMYLVRLINGNAALTERILVQK